MIPEGYCVLNPDCKVAKLTECQYRLTKEDVIAYARMAENTLSSDFLYGI